MNSIIQYLLIQNQYFLQIISFLFKFICKFIPLRQFAFDDSHSPEYQKFKIDKPLRADFRLPTNPPFQAGLFFPLSAPPVFDNLISVIFALR